MKPDFIAELQWRGMLYDRTEGVELVLGSEQVSGYVGFDPTADSLHVGSLLQIMGLVHLQRSGHSPIALIGGATGMIGDPSGKSKERNLLSLEQIAANAEGIKGQLARFLDFEVKQNPAKMVNNADWLVPLSLIDFLRETGKYFTVNYMQAKESVKRRLASEDGISFTEFSYMLLQAFDYYNLHKQLGCRLQMGGSDQWGNIIAGIDLIRRQTGEKAFGIVTPLVTTSAGTKFGKTEEGTVWLDPARTSPYKFYQFWLNTADADAVPYLKFFTLLDADQIEELAQAQAAAPHLRDVQKRLAAEVTRAVHGETALARALAASQVMFGGDISALSAADIAEIFENVPSTKLGRQSLLGDGMPIVDILADCGVTASKGEARRLISGGGIYLNNQRVLDATSKVTLDHSIEGNYLVFRKGAKSYHLVKITSESE